MQTSGGILGIIGGIFGFLAAIFTLFVGGVGGAVEAEGADTVVMLGWGGVLFSFLCIIFGAVVVQAKSKVPGGLLAFSAVAGAILGGTFVAVCLVLAFTGGLLAVLGTKKEQVYRGIR